MKFCCASDRITPEYPVYMQGFGDRQGMSQGVKDDLFVKTVLLVANKPVLIITIDALGSDHGFIDAVKAALYDKFGFTPDEVLINFSHTHHSVHFTKDGYPEDENSFQLVLDKIIRLTEFCHHHLTEGSLLLGHGVSNFAVSRRRPNGDVIEWRPYYEAIIDKELFVIKLVDESERVWAVLYNYGCHPTGMGPDNLTLSNDFVGVTSRILEDRYPGTSAIFLQGCGAELKPLKSANGDGFKSVSFEELEEAGRDLANDIIGILEKGEFESIRCTFKTKLVDPLLYTEQTSPEQHLKVANDPSMAVFYRDEARKAYQAILEGTIQDRVPLYITVWHLDEATRLVAIEGEVSTEYSLLIKKAFKKMGIRQTLTLGYTNGAEYYVPTRKMIREGGYEACGYFGDVRGPFVPEIEDIIIGQIVEAELSLDAET